MDENTATLTDGLKDITHHNNSKEKTHPWRICPIGQHLVKKHFVHMPPSNEHPDGATIERHEHCAINPSKKDLLSFDEIQAITEKYFHRLSGAPKVGVLKGYSNANKRCYHAYFK